MNKKIILKKEIINNIDSTVNDIFDLICNHCDKNNSCCECLWSCISTATNLAIKNDLICRKERNKHEQK